MTIQGFPFFLHGAGYAIVSLGLVLCMLAAGRYICGFSPTLSHPFIFFHTQSTM